MLERLLVSLLNPSHEQVERERAEAVAHPVLIGALFIGTVTGIIPAMIAALSSVALS